MKLTLRIWFIINAVFYALYGMSELFFPVLILKSHNADPNQTALLMARFYGGMLIAMAIMLWLTKDVSDTTVKKGITYTMLVATFSGVALGIIGTWKGVFNPVGWSTLLIQFVLAVGYVYFGFIKKAG